MATSSKKTSKPTLYYLTHRYGPDAECRDRYDFCSCCGAEQFSRNEQVPDLKTLFDESTGISVIFDKVFEERSRGYKRVKHVKTSNGVVTVCTITGLTSRERQKIEDREYGDDYW